MVYQDSYDAHLLLNTKKCIIRNIVDTREKNLFLMEAVVFNFMKDMQIISN